MENLNNGKNHKRIRSMDFFKNTNNNIEYVLDKSNVSCYQEQNSDERKRNFEKSFNVEKSILNCLICFDKSPDSVFMDCGHGGIKKNNLIFFQ